jgi:hypothetical protein
MSNYTRFKFRLTSILTITIYNCLKIGFEINDTWTQSIVDRVSIAKEKPSSFNFPYSATEKPLQTSKQSLIPYDNFSQFLPKWAF